MKRKHVILGLAVLALIAHVFVLPPVPQSKLDKLNPSMSREEVRQLLGEPTRKLGPHGAMWQYKKPLRFGYVDIVFDHPVEGHFSHYNYEEY